MVLRQNLREGPLAERPGVSFAHRARWKTSCIVRPAFRNEDRPALATWHREAINAIAALLQTGFERDRQRYRLRGEQSPRGPSQAFVTGFVRLDCAGGLSGTMPPIEP